MSEDNFFTIGRYSTICSTPNGIYRTYYSAPHSNFNHINSTVNFMCIDESDVSYLNTKLAIAIPQGFPTSQRIRDTLGISIERHTHKALTIGGGEENCLDTLLALDKLIPDNSFLYCIPTATFVVYLNVLYNLFKHTRVEGDSKEELPTTLDNLLEIWCSLPKKVKAGDPKFSFSEVILKVVESIEEEGVLNNTYGNYTIFLEQPKYLMAGILNLIQQKLGKVGPSLYVAKVAGEYSATEFTEAAILCSNIKKLYHACLSCPIADSCVPNLVEDTLSPVVFKEVSLKNTLVKSGMEYVPPSLAALSHKNHYYRYRGSALSVNIQYRPYPGEADSLAANFVPAEIRKRLDTHYAKRIKIKQFRDFTSSKCANCAFNFICSDNLKVDYSYLDKLQDACPAAIKANDLEISKRSVLEFILAAATSGERLNTALSSTTLDTMTTEIGRVLVETKLTLDAKKAIRFIEYMTSEEKHIYKGMFVLPTKLIQVLNKYAKYFTVKYGSTSGDLFHSQYDTIYHNLGMVPGKTDSWVVVKANTLDMYYSESLMQSSRNTLENDDWSRPLFSTIGCKDFLYNVNYEASKKLLRSPKIIRNTPNIDTLLLNLAMLLTPTERRIDYGWGNGCQYSTISLANKATLIALPNIYINLAHKTKQEDLEDPAYPAKFVSMIDTGINSYWGYYHTRSVVSGHIRALSDKEYKKIVALQEKALSKSLIYICSNLYLDNPKFHNPVTKLKLIELLRSKL